MRIACFGIATFLIVCMNVGATEAVHKRSAPETGRPQVTVGAEIKQLRFDWSRTPRAQFYKLLKNPDGHSGFTQVGRDIPRATTTAVDNIAVHLHDWKDARYIVAACNARGCTNSGEIFTNDLMLEAIGYLKSKEPKFADFFGDKISLSASGRTLAIASRGGPLSDSGAVSIFRRDSNGAWTQEDLPLLQVRQAGSGFGFSLQLSADGNTLAVGALSFVQCARRAHYAVLRTVGGDCTEVGAHGAVHLFRRSDAGSWAQESSFACTSTTRRAEIRSRLGAQRRWQNPGCGFVRGYRRNGALHLAQDQLRLATRRSLQAESETAAGVSTRRSARMEIRCSSAATSTMRLLAFASRKRYRYVSAREAIGRSSRHCHIPSIGRTLSTSPIP